MLCDLPAGSWLVSGGAGVSGVPLAARRGLLVMTASSDVQVVGAQPFSLPCSFLYFIQVRGSGGSPRPEAVPTGVGLWGSRGQRLLGVVFATQGAQGFQEELPEGGGHGVVEDRRHSGADVEERVGHHVEVVVEVIESAGGEAPRPG